MFTYFYCLEVGDLSDIPEGMMGFTVPAHTYAIVRYEGPYPWSPDPYDAIAEYRQQHGLESDRNGMVLEFYGFANEAVREEGRLIIDVAVPLKQG